MFVENDFKWFWVSFLLKIKLTKQFAAKKCRSVDCLTNLDRSNDLEKRQQVRVYKSFLMLKFSSDSIVLNPNFKFQNVNKDLHSVPFCWFQQSVDFDSSVAKSPILPCHSTPPTLHSLRMYHLCITMSWWDYWSNMVKQNFCKGYECFYDSCFCVFELDSTDLNCECLFHVKYMTSSVFLDRIHDARNGTQYTSMFLSIHMSLVRNGQRGSKFLSCLPTQIN